LGVNTGRVIPDLKVANFSYNGERLLLCHEQMVRLKTKQ
jgi:hypothetical protein